MPADLGWLELLVASVTLVVQTLAWLWPRVARAGGAAQGAAQQTRAIASLKPTWRVLVALSLVLPIAFLLVRYGPANDWSASPLKRIESRGILVVGVSAEKGPFSSRPSTADWSGFEIDLARALARDVLGGLDKVKFVEVKEEDGQDQRWHDTFWEQNQQNQLDLVISTASIYYRKQDGRERYAFSSPYYVSGQRTLVMEDEQRLTHTESLRAGARVCVGEGENADNLIRAVPGVVPVPRSSTGSCVEDLRRGSIDAISSDEWVLARLIQRYRDFKMLPGSVTTDPYGVAISKSTPNHEVLVKHVNDFLTQYKKTDWLNSYARHLQPLNGDDAALHAFG